LLTTLLKHRKEIGVAEGQQRLEQATIAAIRNLPPEAQAKFFKEIEKGTQ
jgi:hypothetical protein